MREGTPGGHWRTLTLLGALTVQGLRAPMTIESPTDGDVFLAYLEQVLCPQLQPGQVVIMDNLAAHKVDGVRSLIEARGAELLYLPPYSPTSTRLSKLGPRSKKSCVPPKPGGWTPWKRPSLKLLLPSPPTTLSLGSATAATGYTNYETALAKANLKKQTALLTQISAD